MAAEDESSSLPLCGSVDGENPRKYRVLLQVPPLKKKKNSFQLS